MKNNKILRLLITTFLSLSLLVKPVYADEEDNIYHTVISPQGITRIENIIKNYDEYISDQYIEMPKREQLYFEEGHPVACTVVIKKQFSEYKKQWNKSDFNINCPVDITEVIYADTETEEEYTKLGITHQYISFGFAEKDAKTVYNALKTNDKILYISLVHNSITNVEYGNIDNNDDIDVSDLTLLSQYILGDVEFDLKQQVCADVNADDEVNLQDLALLKQYVMNDDVKLGVTNK